LTEKDVGLGIDLKETLDSVKREEEIVKEDEERGVKCNGLRVIGIEKIYKKKACGKSAKDVHAV
jgi:hypothetical protein